MPRRTAVGMDYNRVNLIMAVIEKRMGLSMADFDAYVNIAGGLRISEPSCDLGLVIALVSSFKNRPVADDLMAFGEVGLSGEVRSVSMPGKRVYEAAKMGVRTIVLPESAVGSIENVPDGVELVGVRGIREACDKVV